MSVISTKLTFFEIYLVIFSSSVTQIAGEVSEVLISLNEGSRLAGASFEGAAETKNDEVAAKAAK